MGNRLAFEVCHPDFCRKYVVLKDDVIGVDKFDLSTPTSEMKKMYAFNEEDIINKYKAL